jgi:hypothetical protein
MITTENTSPPPSRVLVLKARIVRRKEDLSNAIKNGGSLQLIGDLRRVLAEYEREYHQLIDIKSTHDLKTWPSAFEPINNEDKLFEIRKNDRDFKVGDRLNLHEWNPESETYSGRVISCKVKYISYGPAWEIPIGYCVMSIEKIGSRMKDQF